MMDGLQVVCGGRQLYQFTTCLSYEEPWFILFYEVTQSEKVAKVQISMFVMGAS